MRRCLMLSAAALALWGAEPARASTEIGGVWLTDDGEAAVEVAPCGGDICGRVVWLKTPTEDGQPLRDANNPSKSARTKPICGLRILGGLKPKGGRYEGGWVYDPESGGRYRLSAELRPNGRLAIIGFVGLESLGETREWRRAPGGIGRCSASGNS
jgi:uncharacterized protein (DUF2147 family)